MLEVWRQRCAQLYFQEDAIEKHTKDYEVASETSKLDVFAPACVNQERMSLANDNSKFCLPSSHMLVPSLYKAGRGKVKFRRRIAAKVFSSPRS